MDQRRVPIGKVSMPRRTTVEGEEIRNVGGMKEKKDAGTRTFPFARIIASGDPVYSFLSGLLAR